MKLQLGKYPEFYKDYDEILEEKTDIFVGRNKWLHVQWESLCRLVNKEEVENLAFLAHRKSGKTSFLRKFYNLIFTHQREAIPFYYEFSNEKQNGKEAARLVLESLICQATDFLLGKSYYIQKGKFPLCLKKLNELRKKYEWASNILERYEYYLNLEKRIPDYRCNELLYDVWGFVHRIDNKPCVLIIDEAQEMARSLFGTNLKGEEVIVPCHRSVSSIYNQQSVWILLSGSRVSELYYNMVGALANRIKRQDFDLLEKNESDELIEELISKYGYKNVYPEIYQDIWDITNGHPFYIQKILDPSFVDYEKVNGEKKNFKNANELKKVLYFEVSHMRGALRRFWENHFIENIKVLDEEKEEQDLTLKILYYIASNKNKKIHYREIEEKFGIESVHKKIQRLRDADLIQIEDQSRMVDKLNDNLLSMFLAKRYSDEIFGERTAKEIRQELDELMRTLVNEKFANVEKTVKDHGKKLKKAEKDKKEFTIKFNKMDKKIKSIDGTIQYHLGMKKQNEISQKITEAIEKNQGIFANIKLLEDLRTIKVYRDRDGKACEMDACALTEVGKEKIALIIEIKNWKNVTGSTQVKDYVEAVKIIQKDMKCEKAMQVYISESGFSKPAINILKKNDVIFGTTAELINKTNVVMVDVSQEKESKTKTKKKVQSNKKQAKSKVGKTKKKTA